MIGYRLFEVGLPVAAWNEAFGDPNVNPAHDDEPTCILPFYFNKKKIFKINIWKLLAK
jgi:hypothetical protein